MGGIMIGVTTLLANDEILMRSLVRPHDFHTKPLDKPFDGTE